MTKKIISARVQEMDSYLCDQSADSLDEFASGDKLFNKKPKLTKKVKRLSRNKKGNAKGHVQSRLHQNVPHNSQL